LIKPSAEWRVDAWDRAAENLHGIPFAVLDERGVEPAAVCDVLSEALRSAHVYSDAPDWDAFWMMRLYEAAGRRADIEIRDLGLALPRLSAAAQSAIADEAERIAPRTHRAGCDAQHLQALFRLAHGR
jgi:hypothetical protein